MTKLYEIFNFVETISTNNDICKIYRDGRVEEASLR